MRMPHVVPAILVTLVACSDGGGADLGDAAFSHYEGTVSFTTANNEFASQTGSLMFSVDLVEHRAADLDAFEGSIQGTFEHTPLMPGDVCAPVQITTTLDTSLMVYESAGSIRGANDPFASKIQLTISGNPGGTRPTRCCLDSSPQSCSTMQVAPNLSVQTGCMPAIFPMYADRATLAGTGTFGCNGVLQSEVTWSLVGSN